MAKRRKHKSGNSVTPLLLTLSILIAIFGIYAYIRFRPVAPAEIFQLKTISLESGPITLEGVIRKDAPLGQPGSYLLILSTGQPIALDVDDLDPLVGLESVISGNLALPTTTTDLPILIVSTITTN